MSMLRTRQEEIEREMFHRALVVLAGIFATIFLCMLN